MRADHGLFCRGGCHAPGRPVSYEVHHVWPQEYHGPSTPDNLVRICCNTHSDTHDLLNRMLRGKPYVLADYTPTVRRLALRGLAAIEAYAQSVAPLRGES